MWVHNVCAIKPNEVTTYADFNARSVKFDSLEGHELLQFSYLKANGMVVSRGGLNPVIALDKGIHADVSALQEAMGLHDPEILKSISAATNIEMNADILRSVGVAEPQVQAIRSAALSFASSLKLL